MVKKSAYPFLKIFSYICVMGLIYKITNPMNEVYVGSTKRESIKPRINEHKYIASKGRKGLVYNSFKNYGFDNHKFETIAEVNNNDLLDLEHFIIQEFKPSLNIVTRYNNTAEGKIWVNNSQEEFQILPKFFKDYKNIKKGRLIKKQ